MTVAQKQATVAVVIAIIAVGFGVAATVADAATCARTGDKRCPARRVVYEIRQDRIRLGMPSAKVKRLVGWPIGGTASSSIFGGVVHSTATWEWRGRFLNGRRVNVILTFTNEVLDEATISTPR